MEDDILCYSTQSTSPETWIFILLVVSSGINLHISLFCFVFFLFFLSKVWIVKCQTLWVDLVIFLYYLSSFSSFCFICWEISVVPSNSQIAFTILSPYLEFIEFFCLFFDWNSKAIASCSCLMDAIHFHLYVNVNYNIVAFSSLLRILSDTYKFLYFWFLVWSLSFLVEVFFQHLWILYSQSVFNNAVLTK